eukprot:g9072.t2
MEMMTAEFTLGLVWAARAALKLKDKQTKTPEKQAEPCNDAGEGSSSKRGFAWRKYVLLNPDERQEVKKADVSKGTLAHKPWHLERRRVMNTSMEGLTRDRAPPLVGLVGGSGSGKTTAASEFVKSNEARKVFADGILWLAVNDGARESLSLLRRQLTRMVYETIGGSVGRPPAQSDDQEFSAEDEASDKGVLSILELWTVIRSEEGTHPMRDPHSTFAREKLMDHGDVRKPALARWVTHIFSLVSLRSFESHVLMGPWRVVQRVGGYDWGWDKLRPYAMERAEMDESNSLLRESPEAATDFQKTKYAEADPLYRRAIEIGEKTPGSIYSDLATSTWLNHSAVLWRDQNACVLPESEIKPWVDTLRERDMPMTLAIRSPRVSARLNDWWSSEQDQPTTPPAAPGSRERHISFGFLWRAYTWCVLLNHAEPYGSGGRYNRGNTARISRRRSEAWPSFVPGVVVTAGLVPGVAATESLGERLEPAVSAFICWLCQAHWSVNVLIVTLAGVSVYKSIVFSIGEINAGNAEWQAVIARIPDNSCSTPQGRTMPNTPTRMARRLHHAAERQVQSANVVPFASRKLLVSLLLRLCLRTSRPAGLTRLAVAAVVAAAASACGTWVFALALVLSLAVLLTSWRSLLPRKAWEDPSVVQINRLPTHSRLRNYPSFEQAAARENRSPNVVDLSGTWKFLLASGVSKAPTGFQDPAYSDSSWNNIRVPGHWQLQDAGSTDPPIYTNTNYPFPNHPPYAPRENPTGLYRRSFTLPVEWLSSGAGEAGGGGREGLGGESLVGQRLLPVEGSGGARLKGRAVLVFQGVDSAFHVWVNGVLVGFAKGSRLPCEFDVTDALRGGSGDQCLCLRVVRWSDGSYLEDQDHWWLSGVYREVELALRPAPARISDFVARPFLGQGRDGAYTQGSLEVEVLIERDGAAQPTSGWVPGRLGAAAATATAAAAAAARPAAIADSGGVNKRTRTGYIGKLDEDGGQTASFSLGRVEAGEGEFGGGDPAPTRAAAAALAGEADEEVVCTLVDTATGECFRLKPGGALPDWQMGQPPGAEVGARRDGHRVHRRAADDDAFDAGASRFRSWFGLASRLRSRQVNSGDSSRSGAYGAGGDGGEGARQAATTRSVLLFRLDVPGKARAWTAEDPQLYTLVVSLRQGGGGGGGLGWGGAVAVEGLSSSSSSPSYPAFEQYESARVGFRSLVVASGQLLVNGRAVMVAGVNRHEHDEETGKTVSEESMRRDIVMMKKFNFNAVRNCHYPNHWRWYELCDELGLYVCDEANIESHGQIPLGRLSADPSWRLAYLDRVWRMVAANKNHACIVLWSLGNESGDGENFSACRRLVKEVDPSRPVVYEGGGESLAEGCGCTELTDIVCPMYPTLETTELLGLDGPDGVGETRPCVLCEYSHAMGNSNGNLHKYWELFRKHRRLQGGFIWDWVDQGLTKYDLSTGRKYWADGGGFTGGHSKGYDAFCVNGLSFPDRSPHPAMYEAKFLSQPVGIELSRGDRSSPLRLRGTRRKAGGNKNLDDIDKLSSSSPPSLLLPSPPPPLRLLLTNRYGFLSLDHLSTSWRLRSSTSSSAGSGADPYLVAAGSLTLALSGLAPGESREISVEVPPAAAAAAVAAVEPRIGRAGGTGEVFLHVEARLAAESAWAPEGHLVAWGCFPVSGLMPAGNPPRALLPSPPPPASASQGVAPEAVKVEGSGDDAVAVAGLGAGVGAVPETASAGFIAYEDEDSSAPSSREASPLVQLRQHLLTDTPTSPPASSVIVMRGLLDPDGVVGGVAEGGSRAFQREWTVIVNRVEGSIIRFLAGGVDLIEPGGGPSLCFWRAATDNDRAGWPTLLNFVVDHRIVGLLSKFLPLSRLSHLERWKASGVSASDPPVFKVQGVRVERSSAQECIIKVKTSCKSRRGSVPLFAITTEIRISAGGNLEVTNDVEPLKGVSRDRLSLARVGMALKLPPGFGHVEWFGRGPFECYQDRKHGATTDVFYGKVEDQHVPYMVPSENGGKADVRWMALRRGEEGAGLLLQAETGTVFEAASVGLHSAAELHKAKRTVDLPLRNSVDDPVFVHLDHRSMGVGGDNSWYPNVVHEEYTVPANKAYRFRVLLRALGPGGAAAPTAASIPPASRW